MREPLIVLLLLLAPARPVAAETYDEALAGASLLADGGYFAEAARALEGPAKEWSQDYLLQLARAFYLLRAGQYSAAEAQYRVAVELQPGAPEARRGLLDASLGRGAPSQVWLTLGGGGASYGGQTTRSTLLTGALRLDVQLHDRWAFGALYRGLGTTASFTGGGRGKRAGSSGSVQSEGHLWLGVAAPEWQLTLHGAGITRSAMTRAGVEQVYGYGGAAAGLSAMLRTGLEWRASAVTTWYEDLTTTQLEGTGTALLLRDRLALRAGVRTQLTGGAAVGSALAAVEWRGPWSLILSGEYGPQRRPIDLEAHVLYDLGDELEWAARLQAGVLLGHRTRAWIGADLEAWRTSPSLTPQADYTATRISAGLTFSY